MTILKRSGVGGVEPRPYGGQKKVCDCFGIYINKKNERKKK